MTDNIIYNFQPEIKNLTNHPESHGQLGPDGRPEHPNREGAAGPSFHKLVGMINRIPLPGAGRIILCEVARFRNHETGAAFPSIGQITQRLQLLMTPRQKVVITISKNVVSNV
ncbi:MAG: hypothetical protein ACE15F_15475, partial [bacterium]